LAADWPLSALALASRIGRGSAFASGTAPAALAWGSGRA